MGTEPGPPATCTENLVKFGCVVVGKGCANRSYKKTLSATLRSPSQYAGRYWGDAENARPENDGQRKLWVWKMQDWKMTDKILAKCEHNYGVWKMQEYKPSWVQPTHTVYIKEAVRDTLQSSTGMSCPLCCTPIDMVMCVYFDVYLANYRKTLFELD